MSHGGGEGSIPVRELITLWGFDIDAKPLEHLEHRVETLKHTIHVLAETLVGGALTLFGLAEASVHTGVELLRTSERLGINIEKLQELRFAARHAGLGAEEFGTAIQMLNRHVADASLGTGEAAVMFRRLGISVRDENGHIKSTDVVLGQVADALARTHDQALRTKIAFDFFGRGGVPML